MVVGRRREYDCQASCFCWNVSRGACPCVLLNFVHYLCLVESILLLRLMGDP